MGYNRNTHRMIRVECSDKVKEVERFLLESLLQDSPDYGEGHIGNIEYQSITDEGKTFSQDFRIFLEKHSKIVREDGQIGGLWTDNQNLNMFINLNRLIIRTYNTSWNFTSTIFWFLQGADIVKDKYSFKELTVFQIFKIDYELQRLVFRDEFILKFINS